MGSPDLLVICASAFVAVFSLLAVLAVVMRLIVVIFPQSETKVDATVIAAVASVVSTLYPGTEMTNIEEIK